MHPFASGSSNQPGRLAPHLRCAAAFGLILWVASLPRHLDWLYLAPAGLVLVAWGLCHAPLRFVLRRLLVIEWFILGIGVLTLLTPSAAPVFLAAVVKSNLCGLTLVLLTWTTSFDEVLGVLSALRLPGIMVTTLALLCRYLPVLVEESRRMQRARASRTFSGKRRLAWGSAGATIGHLFARSADRAERIFLAMCARGWK